MACCFGEAGNKGIIIFQNIVQKKKCTPRLNNPPHIAHVSNSVLYDYWQLLTQTYGNCSAEGGGLCEWDQVSEGKCEHDWLVQLNNCIVLPLVSSVVLPEEHKIIKRSIQNWEEKRLPGGTTDTSDEPDLKESAYKALL